MVRKISLLLVFISISSLGASPPGIKFLHNAKEMKILALAQIKKAVPVKQIEVWEPHEQQPRSYTGVALRELLQHVYGDKWHDGDEILFTCEDGFQPSIPIQRIQEKNAYLVFARKAPKGFAIKDRYRNGRKVELGPYYLVWDNLNAGVSGDSTHEWGWPYQLVSLDVIRFSERFPHMAPPDSAPAEAKRGFSQFRARCLSCHSINGEGSATCFELNYPANVTEYYQRPWLEKWISAPTEVRYDATMPGLKDSDEKWQEHLPEIISYLEAMVGKKLKPVPK